MDVLGTEVAIPAGWECEQTDEKQFRAWYTASDGRIDLRYYAITRGVLLLDIDLACHSLSASNPVGPSFYTLNWCSSGRCEVDLGARGSTVVSERSLCLSRATANAFSYPTGRYRGFEYVVDIDQLDDNMRATLQLFDLGDCLTARKLLVNDSTVIISVEGNLEHAVRSIEAELSRRERNLPRLALRSLELLLSLEELDPQDLHRTGTYLQRGQRDMAQSVYAHLMSRISPETGLDQLAHQMGVSVSSLRSYFAKVYGTTPAAFARSRALSHAASLLNETTDSVAEISAACGYTNPSKFAAAFKRAYETSPSDYRLSCRAHHG